MRYPPAVMQLTFQRARTEQKKRQRARYWTPTSRLAE
jgi:hypothetical protein